MTITLLYLTLLGNIEMTSFEIPSKESWESWFHYNVIGKGNKNRCRRELSLHVLDIMDSILESGKNNKKINLRSECEMPQYFSEEENSALLKG